MKTIRRSYLVAFAVVVAMALLFVMAGSSVADAGDTTRASIADGSGAQANGSSLLPSISADGRYVAFGSGATNLVAGDTNGASDAFLHERQETQPKECIAPTTTHTLSPTPNAAGWNNSDVIVTLDATDTGGSGVKEIRYSATGADAISQQTVAAANLPATFTIDAEGTTTLSYFATDNEGNQETAKTLTVKVDKRPPTANVSINDGDEFTNDTVVNLSLGGGDPYPGSGVFQMRFSNDGTNWSEWEPFVTSKEWAVSEGDGEKTVHVQFKDAAGNQSDTAQDTIVLDQTAPVVSSTSPSNNQTGVVATADISATFSESGSGIDLGTFTNSTFQVVQLKPPGNVPVSSGTFSLNEDSQGSQTVTFDPASSLAKGAYRVTITGVEDKAGNALANDYTWQFATAGLPKR